MFQSWSLNKVTPWIAVFFLAIGGCAHSTPDPVAVDVITVEERAAQYTHLLITSETARGVFVPSHHQETLRILVERELFARAPDKYSFIDGTGLAPATAQGVETAGGTSDIPDEAPQTLHMKIIFTRFDEGNSFARFMLAGLGQIHIDTHVVVSDHSTGTVLGEYDVSKQFAFGGLYGGTTDVDDVQGGLAKGIADVLEPET